MADRQPVLTPVAKPPFEQPPSGTRAGMANLVGSWDLVLRLGLVGIVVLLFVIFALTTPGFATLETMQDNGREMAVVGVLAIGETFVIITRGIDLSVGSSLGLSGVVAGLELLNGWPMLVAILTPLVLGTLIGLFNGLLIDSAKIPPFIVTLGMLGILRGIALIAGNGQQVSFTASGFTDFAEATSLGVPNLFIVLVVVCIGAGVFLHFTRRGRYIYALGSNPEGTRLAGINVRWTTLTVYAISGLCAGVAGVLLTARQRQGDPNAGTSYELDAIAAAVLGGASLFGARGSIFGTFLGVLLVQVVSKGIGLQNLDPAVARMIEGALLIAVVWLDQWRKRRVVAA